MQDENIVRIMEQPKLKGILKGKEEEENIADNWTFGSEFEGLIVEMEQMLDQDLAQTA